MQLSYKRFKLLSLVFVITTIGSCTKTENHTQPLPLPAAASSDKVIISFALKTINNSSLTTDIEGTIGFDTIKLFVPNLVPLNNLTPTIIFKGKSISPQNNLAQNLTYPVTYTVIAEDGTTKSYIVQVKTVAIIPDVIPGTLFINSYNDAFPFVSTPVNAYAIDANTGKVRWTYTSATGGFSASPAFSNGILYTANVNKIISIDTITRKTNWEYNAGANIGGALLVVSGLVYINCDDGNLYAIDANNGKLRWKFQQDGNNPNGNPSSPTVVGGVVYFASSKGPYVYALDANTGTLKWKTFNSYDAGGSSGTFVSSPSVVDGVLYVADVYRNLLAIDISNGSIKWSFVSGDLYRSSPTVVNNIVYIGCADGYLYAVNATTGTLKWKYPTAKGVDTSPIVSEGIVYFGSLGGVFYALDANTGIEKWKYSNGTYFESSPIIFNGNVYIAYVRNLVALNAITGGVKWTFTTINNHEWVDASSPCIVDQKGNVYYSAVSGHQN